MANIPLKSIQFPGLDDTYTVPTNAGELPYDKNATYPADTVGKALQDKPDADGTIANAEQLTSNIYEEDNTPYNFRTSGGSIDIGDRETDMLVGGTVAWNQLFEALTASALDGITTNYDVNTHLISIINDSRTSNYSSGSFRGPVLSGVVGNHKYLYAFSQSMAGVVLVNVSGGVLPMVFNGSALPDTKVYLRITKDYDFVTAHPVGSVVKLYLNIFDLTAMFGTTIADYIYSLEQATAGAGVAWFRKLFPKPYYAYNAGELMSVQASSHDMVGFNQWDEEWETGYRNVSTGAITPNASNITNKNLIPVLPNTAYYWRTGKTSGGNALCFFDANGNYIGYQYPNYNTVFTTPSNAHFLAFTVDDTTYNNDICINLSWDGERDGEYEAYVKHSYPLDSSLTLRGIPKLDANGNLYYDGDTYESDGSVTRKYGVVDLGTLTWYYNSASGRERFYTPAQTSVKAPSSESTKANVISSKYASATDLDTYFHNADKIVAVSQDGRFYVYDTAYTDAATFKTAMSGVYLIYELATPTTETADPFTNPQIVNDFGTEEYVDYAVSQGDRDVSIPVGHQTQYMANLKAKLEMSPNSPEGAGDYIVRQTNGENEYVTLASNATIQNIIARLEALENAES